MWPTDPLGLIHRSNALAVGRTDGEIAAAISAKELLAVDRGLYVPSRVVPEDGRRRAIYRLRCLAAPTQRNGALSHQSAASVLGLPTLNPDLSVVHFSVPGGSGGKRIATRHIHCGLDDADVVVHDGVPVTSPVRTAVDVAAASDFAGALAVFDSALRLGVPRDALLAEVERRRRRGIVRIRAALAHADPGAANPGESWSRAQLLEAGLPVPTLQRRYDLPDGDFALVDFDWEGKVVGEFDGLRKYTRDRRPGEAIEDVVVREKRREDRLRALGLIVVRWIWADLKRGTVAPTVRARLTAASIRC